MPESAPNSFLQEFLCLGPVHARVASRMDVSACEGFALELLLYSIFCVGFVYYNSKKFVSDWQSNHLRGFLYNRKRCHLQRSRLKLDL